MVGIASELRTSPYLSYPDPFARGLTINPDDLPEELAQLVRQHDREFGDRIDNPAELRRLMEMVQQNGGEVNGLPRPDFKNLGSLSSQDMLQMLVDWINSGGPEANKRVTQPRPIGNLSSPSGGYHSTPTSWGGGGSGGGVAGTSQGGGSTSGGPQGAAPTGDTKPLKKSDIDTSKVDTSKIPHFNELSPKVQEAAKIAIAMGLQVTSTTEGQHAPNSNHYSGHAVDVAGSPELMAKFYNTMKSLDSQPMELFYDPIGGIKNGQEIGAIGGHSDHVHYAG